MNWCDRDFSENVELWTLTIEYGFGDCIFIFVMV